mmetsp:Transcript_34102/g.100456  ORF Transcript_34102/g.100456 Transcript_34102/m.100456 type:complete len:123 (+) Transcript_34102:250-618(+)
MEFQYFDSDHPAAIIKTTDLLFVSAPPMAGSAVTECEGAGGHTHTCTRHNSTGQNNDEDDDDGSADGSNGDGISISDDAIIPENNQVMKIVHILHMHRDMSRTFWMMAKWNFSTLIPTIRRQ